MDIGQCLSFVKIAREMVISPSNARLGLTVLTKRIGLKARQGGQDGELIRYEWDDPRVTLAEMTPEISELFTRELTRYIEETEDLAIKGLEQNRHILDEISKELLEKSRITGLEVQEQMKRLSPIMFEDFAKPFQIDLNQDQCLLIYNVISKLAQKMSQHYCQANGVSVTFQEDPLPHNDRLCYKPLDIYPAPLHRC
ncbi:hypothetical protein Cgig2_026395 [Carnegiea gigantea]|uniref:Uncharacterized protein n=1 Tax=Carnegiea gigantea TaxID=171969 RepID=A0A9Q1K2M3_9CARY|nr:hypothetical protein Cgig2_026395 [Carnegiea gigantea]